MKTILSKITDDRSWHMVDAEGKSLGRLCSDIAKYLIGKHKITYTPNLDNGDFVIVINAEKVVLTGNKLLAKMYYSHSGIPGGFKEKRAEEVMAKDPARIIEHAVHGMLPKNKLSDVRMGRLKVYSGTEHPHTNHIITSEK